MDREAYDTKIQQLTEPLPPSDEEMTVLRLLELLEEKDKEITKAKREASRLSKEISNMEKRWGWCRHQLIGASGTPDPTDLPVPRLEIAWEQDGRTTWCATYGLIYRTHQAQLMGVPFSRVWRFGCEGKPFIRGIIDIPILERMSLIHDCANLGLPGYIRCGDKVSSLEIYKRDYKMRFGVDL